MSYLIQVSADASSLLRTLAPHIVLHLGRALAELSELLGAGGEADTDVLRIDDCVLQFVIDRGSRLLRVVSIEQHDRVLPAFARAG